MKEHRIKVIADSILKFIYEETFDNILVIGDPHIYNARPGRRRDESFLDTILDKLSQAKDIANAKNCFTIITGDFFHTKTIEIKSEFINKIIKVLKQFKTKPLVLSGNHEKAEWVITEKDALSILVNTDLIDVLDGNEIVGKIKVKDKIIGIGGTCFGETIPYDLTQFIGMEGGKTFRDEEELALFKLEKEEQKNRELILITKTPKDNSDVDLHNKIKENMGVDEMIWVTHHDLAFGENYPFSRPLHPIDGVDILINGHMHNYKKPVKKDLTQCYNPGNIVRIKIDEIDNEPSVWLYDPMSNEKELDINGDEVKLLKQIKLNFKPFEEVFSLEGRNIVKSNKDINIDTSKFVSLMLNDNATEKTDEAVFIKEELDNEKDNFSEPAYHYILKLLEDCIREEQR